MGGPCPSVSRRLTGWLFAFLGFAALAVSAQAQTATVTGRVLNQATGDYLKYAQIQIVGSDQSTYSEEGGYYTLTNVPAGEVKLTATYTGLDTKNVTVTVPAEGVVRQDINLTTAEYGDVVKLDEVRVSGVREGNSKAIVIQKIALNFKMVIATDTFGDVAEGNVGEFLKLLPGISVDYVDNDVRSTRIRGLPPKYNTTTMDGHPIANAASSAIGTGRQLELEQVSMAALDIVENTKTPTPDMMTANLAGNVNAISKSAFDQRGRSIRYQGSVNFNQWNTSFDKTTGWDNNNHSKALFGGKVEWIDSFFSGKLGTVMSVAHSGAYAEQRIVIGSQIWDKNPDNNNVELPLLSSWNFQHGLKPTWRDSLLLNLDYKASNDLKLSLRTSYGYYRSEFYNRNWLANANTTGLTTYDAVTGVLLTTATNVGQINRTETAADSLGSTTNSSVRIAGSNQRKSGGTFITSPAVSWKHDNLKVDASASYSQAKNAYTSGQDGYFSLVQADMQKVSWHSERVADNNVVITQLNTTGSNQGSIFDLANYNAAGSVNNERRNSKDQMWTVNGDVDIDLPNLKIPTKLKFGAADSLEVRDIGNFQAKWNMALGGATVTNPNIYSPTNPATSSVGSINLANYRESFTGAVGTVTDINGVRSGTPAVDKWALFQLFQSYGNTDPLSGSNNGPFVAQAQANLRYLLQNHFNIKEDIQAAYAMATFKPTKRLSVVAGLRFEKTDTQGRAFDDKGDLATLAAIGINTSTLTAGTTGVPTSTAAVNAANSNRFDYIYYRYGGRVTREKTYNTTLPVIQGRYQITNNFVARAAYYSSLLRPDFQSVIGGVSGADNGDGSYTFTINNTSLKPETANNYDASLEYYFEPVGVFSVAVFYKDIKNIQITQPSIFFSAAPSEIQAQVAAAGYGASELSNPLNKFTTTINGPDTTLWGYELAYSQELSFLPGVLKGLGVTANFSHYEPKEVRIWPLVPNTGDGMALNQANLIGRYKIGKFKAQVTGTWTEKRISALAGLTLNPDGSFTKGTGTNSNMTSYLGRRWIISTSMEYELKRYATIFVGVNNIFNAAKYNYNERPVFTNRNGNYGASINVGVKGAF